MRWKKVFVKSVNRVLGRTGLTLQRNPEHLFLSQYDQAIQETVEFVAPFTMTPVFKTAELCDAVRHIVRAGISGAFVECGVWRGGSMMAVAHTLLQEGVRDRELFLFDTFAGMTKPTASDISITSGVEATALYDARLRADGGTDWCHATQQDVLTNMKMTNYPPTRIHLKPGIVENTIPSEAPEKIALLRLDTDWYESTLHELEHLYDRIMPGGILIIDDYDSWQGARKAADQFFENRKTRLYLHRMGGRLGRIAVVP